MAAEGGLPNDVLAAMNTKQMQEVLATMAQALLEEKAELAEEERAVGSLPQGAALAAATPALLEHKQVVEVKELIADKLQRYHTARGGKIAGLSTQISAMVEDKVAMDKMVVYMPQQDLWDIFVMVSREVAQMKLELGLQQNILEGMSGTAKDAQAVEVAEIQQDVAEKVQLQQWLEQKHQAREQMVAELSSDCEKQVEESGEIREDDMKDLQLWCLNELARIAENEMLELLTAIEIRREEVAEMVDGSEKEHAEVQLNANQSRWESKATQASSLEELRQRREATVTGLRAEVVMQMGDVGVPDCWAAMSAKDKDDVVMMLESEIALQSGEGDQAASEETTLLIERLRL